MTSIDSSRVYEMDAALSSSGTVEKDMFFLMLEAHDYDAASSVRWLETKLRVLHELLQSGKSISVYLPATGGSAPVSSVADFDQWIGQHFPNSRRCYLHPF
jgi:hypothetical protein